MTSAYVIAKVGVVDSMHHCMLAQVCVCVCWGDNTLVHEPERGVYNGRHVCMPTTYHPGVICIGHIDTRPDCCPPPQHKCRGHGSLE
jgi:hypothetical protein